MKFQFLYIIKKIHKLFIDLCSKNRFLCEVLIVNPRKKRQDKVNQPIIKASIERLLSYDKLPYPIAVEIETYNKCNGDCDFCPINKNLDPREHKYMKEELFYSIIAQLKEIGFKGYLSEFSNNEPLLDSRIFEFSKHIKQELPLATKIIFTNGLLLNLDKFYIIL